MCKSLMYTGRLANIVQLELSIRVIDVFHQSQRALRFMNSSFVTQDQSMPPFWLCGIQWPATEALVPMSVMPYIFCCTGQNACGTG